MFKESVEQIAEAQRLLGKVDTSGPLTLDDVHRMKTASAILWSGHEKLLRLLGRLGG
jgi:hypothetical protein